MRTQLEVALGTDTAPQDWPGVARDVLTDVERLGRLADDLLLLARLDGDTATALQSVPVDLAGMAGVGGPPAWVIGDPASLRRMLDNLLANARRHSVAEVDVQAVIVDGAVLVMVDDDGPGLSGDDRERVFERWVRLDDARSREDGGSGLGLPIARSIARAHGGDVRLEVSPLGGLRAVVSLPARDLQVSEPRTWPASRP